MDKIMIIALVLSGVIGLCVGSFLNVVIYRLPNKMSLAKPASHCPKCNNKIKWYDNIPVLSYLFLGGKCRYCKEHISFRYTIVEMLNAVLWMCCVLMFWEKSIPYSITAMFAISIFICIFFIDLEKMIIPDSLQIALLVVAVSSIFTEWDENNTWLVKLIGLLVCGGFFLIVHYFCIKMFNVEGIGGGDVKLFAVLGLFLGLTNAFLTILISSVTACLVLLAVKIIKKFDRNREYPFAPFIIIGATVSLFFGYEIVQFYLSLL